MIRHCLLSMVVVFGYCLLGHGAITGPDQVELGGKLVLGVDDPADTLIWIMPQGVEYEAVDGNRKVYVWAKKKGSYTFTVCGFKVDWENRVVLPMAQQTKVVVIGDKEPDDPDDPDEPVDPVLTGLAKEVYTWGMSVDEAYRAKAKDLAGNYAGVSSKLKSVDLTIAQALDELRSLNNKVLDSRESKDKWAVFGSRLQEKMEASWPMDKTIFCGFLDDVSLGLSKVK